MFYIDSYVRCLRGWCDQIYLDRYLQISAQMSFPPGDVIVTPFVGADDENNGAVAPPQGSEFFKDVEGEY